MSRQFLLERATEAFAEDGYAGASMAGIAARAGLRKSSLFHHFSSKDALYQEVFGLIVDDLSRLIADAQMAADASFTEQVDQIAVSLTRYLATHTHAARLLLRESIDRGPFFASGGQQAVLLVLKAAADFLAHGMREGHLPTQEPHQLVMTLCGAHFVWFAASALTTDLIVDEVFAEQAIATRAEAMRLQTRLLCRLPLH